MRLGRVTARFGAGDQACPSNAIAAFARLGSAPLKLEEPPDGVNALG